MFSFVTTVTMILAEAKQSKLLFVFDIDVVSMDNSIIPNAEETINLWTKTWNSSNITSSCQFGSHEKPNDAALCTVDEPESVLREQAIDDDALNEALKKYATSTSLSVYYNEDTVHAIYQMEPPPGKVPQEVLIVVGLIVAALLIGYWWREKLKDVSVDREINMIPIIRKPVSDGSSDSSSSCDIAMEISSDEATPLRKLRKKQPRLTDKMHEMIGNILPSDDEDEKPVEEKVAEGKSKKKTKEVPADEATTRKSKRNTRKEPADEATTRKSKRNTTKEPADEATMRKSTFSESIYTTKKSKRPEGTSTRRKTENDLADEKLKKKKQKSRASPSESDSIV